MERNTKINMKTQEIIQSLRDDQFEIMRPAADRLEELHRQLEQAVAERTPHDYGLLRAEVTFLRKERDDALAEAQSHREALMGSLKQIEALKNYFGDAKKMIRPEPSRLEIAAWLKAGWFANRDADFNAADHGWWIEQADKLIEAAAREAK